MENTKLLYFYIYSKKEFFKYICPHQFAGISLKININKDKIKFNKKCGGIIVIP